MTATHAILPTASDSSASASTTRTSGPTVGVTAHASSGVPRHAARSASVAPVPFIRLLAVETRKLVDTRASRWLLVATFAVAALFTGLSVYLAPQIAPGLPLPASEMVTNSIGSLTVLLPVMAILLAAGEWTQHGAIVTFTLEPRRLRVLAAKLAAVVAASLALCVAVSGVALATGAIAAGVGHQTVTWQFNAATIAWAVVATVLSGLQGFAFGALLMNTPAAIVLYLLYPVVLQGLSAIGPKVAEVTDWLSTSNAFAPLIQGHWTDVHWGKVAVSVGVWVVLPLIAGSVRLVRREVK